MHNIKKIGIIALGGNCDNQKVQQAKLYFESTGIEAVLSQNIHDEKRYLAGSDDVKVRELHNFFEDTSIDLILNARGGYGSIRLLNLINYELIKSNPKPFCGFSDITALLLMIYKKTGLLTYHSPMACSDFGNDKVNDFTVNGFKKALCGEEIVLNSLHTYSHGNSEGIIWGGNLSTVVSMCGIDFIPDIDFIFFTEDLNEPVYKIDRMFQQLFNTELFKKNCKGLVLGDFLGIDNQNWLQDYFNELAEKYAIPIIKVKNITHNEEKVTIPIGRNVCLDDSKLVIKQALC